MIAAANAIIRKARLFRVLAKALLATAAAARKPNATEKDSASTG
jgi:hypothetical protein